MAFKIAKRSGVFLSPCKRRYSAKTCLGCSSESLFSIEIPITVHCHSCSLSRKNRITRHSDGNLIQKLRKISFVNLPTLLQKVRHRQKPTILKHIPAICHPFKSQ